MLMPNHKEITNQTNDNDERYQCRSCKKTFLSEETQTEQLPNNFHVAGLEDGQQLPKCPHCGYIAFFGFTKVPRGE